MRPPLWQRLAAHDRRLSPRLRKRVIRSFTRELARQRAIWTRLKRGGINGPADLDRFILNHSVEMLM